LRAAEPRSFPLYFAGAEADSVALYEQLLRIAAESIFATSINSAIPVVFEAPLECLQQIGFDRDDAAVCQDHRVFEASTCCANISPFRASFSAAVSPASMRSCRASSRGRSILSLP